MGWARKERQDFGACGGRAILVSEPQMGSRDDRELACISSAMILSFNASKWGKKGDFPNKPNTQPLDMVCVR
jgi:hypothetical protein